MKRIDNLVFEGGGVKGIAYCGVIEVLDKLNLLNKVKRIAGTSAGGITALLLCLGYSAEETIEIVKNTPFNKFKDDDLGYGRDFFRLITNYGIYKGDYFYNWLSELIEKKLGKANITFKELTYFENTKELYLTGTNLTKQRVEIFSEEHTPMMEIRLACRITMSIPFFFQAVELNGDILVDGGLAYNYPIDIFDSFCAKESTIGFRVDSKEELNYSSQGKNNPMPTNNLEKVLLAILQFYGAMTNKNHLNNDNFVRTGFIDSLDIGTVEFDITKERTDKLIQSGRVAADKFLVG